MAFAAGILSPVRPCLGFAAGIAAGVVVGWVDRDCGRGRHMDGGFERRSSARRVGASCRRAPDAVRGHRVSGNSRLLTGRMRATDADVLIGERRDPVGSQYQ
jgi:hypothetical protein